MHIKFLAHGAGDPRKAANYLMSQFDHTGAERAGVRLLCGTPAIVAETAASLQTVHRYTSGVIAWAKEDDPTQDDIASVLQDFERTAFAGLQMNQYCWSAIQHFDYDESTHVHVFAVRVELLSGKALNIAPPGWQKTFDSLRDAWNYEKGWARPDDPSRSRSMLLGRRLGAQSRNRWAKMSGTTDALLDALAVEPETESLIASWIFSRVRAGSIRTRADVIRSLSELGELSAVSESKVSVRIAEASFSATLNLANLLAAADQPALRTKYDAPNEAAAMVARCELDAAIGRRGEYNKQRYPAAPLRLETRVLEQVNGADGKRQEEAKSRKLMRLRSARWSRLAMSRSSALSVGRCRRKSASISLSRAELSVARRIFAVPVRGRVRDGSWRGPEAYESVVDRFLKDCGFRESFAERERKDTVVVDPDAVKKRQPAAPESEERAIGNLARDVADDDHAGECDFDGDDSVRWPRERGG